MQKVFERPNAIIYASMIEDEILNLFILDKKYFVQRNFISKTFSNFTVMRDRFIVFLKNYADLLQEGETYVEKFVLKKDNVGTVDYMELYNEGTDDITMFHVTTHGDEMWVNTELHLTKMSLSTLITTIENLS